MPSVGGVAERSNAAVSKTVSGLWVRRGFKSLPLRYLSCSRAQSCVCAVRSMSHGRVHNRSRNCTRPASTSGRRRSSAETRHSYGGTGARCCAVGGLRRRRRPRVGRGPSARLPGNRSAWCSLSGRGRRPAREAQQLQGRASQVAGTAWFWTSSPKGEKFAAWICAVRFRHLTLPVIALADDRSDVAFASLHQLDVAAESRAEPSVPPGHQFQGRCRPRAFLHSFGPCVCARPRRQWSSPVWLW